MHDAHNLLQQESATPAASKSPHYANANATPHVCSGFLCGCSHLPEAHSAVAGAIEVVADEETESAEAIGHSDHLWLLNLADVIGLTEPAHC